MKTASDSIILWANLLILLLLFLKFAAKPFIDFIRGRKKKLPEEVADLEIKKEVLLGEIRNINRAINEKESILKNAGENIIKQAERKKSEIIKEAEHESDLILTRTKQKTEDRILHEAQNLYTEIRSEMLIKNMGEPSGKASVNKSDNTNENGDS